jgi:hypothetical protein
MISHRQLLPTCGRTAPQQLASAKLMVSSLWSTAHSKSKPAGMTVGESNRLKAGARPMLGRLSEITPSPTQRCMLTAFLCRQRLNPCRR